MNLVLRLTTVDSNTREIPVKTCMGQYQYDGSVLRQLHAVEMAGFLEALLALREALTAPSELD